MFNFCVDGFKFFICLGGGGVVYGISSGLWFLLVLALECVEVISLYMGNYYKYVCPVIKS
ncbi:hypothetical protein [Methanobrevibacter cuticularis]|uniref:hypothetical protein n=1 Tax=Methanobrevibacter cuticularis TaxID=47311 RepID=UPI0012EE62A8|nr:hypothetical protein [Methanobrevibacter cuticularis]